MSNCQYYRLYFEECRVKFVIYFFENNCDFISIIYLTSISACSVIVRTLNRTIIMAEKASKEAKQPMSDAERAALCQKLDQELDDFIDGLEKKRYTEGWPEDKWEVINWLQFHL